MLGEETFRIDLMRLFQIVGEIADRSCNDFDPNTADLSDWLTENEILNTNDLEKVPPQGPKALCYPTSQSTDSKVSRPGSLV